MKKELILAVCAVLALAGCEWTPDVTYMEADDVANNTVPEMVGSLSDGSLAILGTISSGTDDDYYRVDIGYYRYTSTDLEVFYNGESQRNILGISVFPFEYVAYDDTDTSIGTYYGGAGAMDMTFNEGTAYVIILVHGTEDYTSGDYEIHLN